MNDPSRDRQADGPIFTPLRFFPAAAIAVGALFYIRALPL
jgi:hypothetical protein